MGVGENTNRNLNVYVGTFRCQGSLGVGNVRVKGRSGRGKDVCLYMSEWGKYHLGEENSDNRDVWMSGHSYCTEMFRCRGV